MCEIVKSSAMNKEFFYCREHKKEAINLETCEEASIYVPITFNTPDPDNDTLDALKWALGHGSHIPPGYKTAPVTPANTLNKRSCYIAPPSAYGIPAGIHPSHSFTSQMPVCDNCRRYYSDTQEMLAPCCSKPLAQSPTPPKAPSSSCFSVAVGDQLKVTNTGIGFFPFTVGNVYQILRNYQNNLAVVGDDGVCYEAPKLGWSAFFQKQHRFEPNRACCIYCGAPKKDVCAGLVGEDCDK